MKRLVAVLALTLLAFEVFAEGQKDAAKPGVVTYPTKSMMIVVPYVAGGAADVIARKIASLLEPKLGKPVVVMNKVGAGGVLAATEYLKEEADTHNLILLSRALTVTVPLIQTNTLMFTTEDFVPIIGIENIEFILFANKKTGITDMKSLVAYAQTKKSLKYGTTGSGTDASVLQAGLFATAGVKAEAVVYNGAKEALLAAANNVVDVAAATPSAALDLIREGSVVPVGIFSGKPFTGFPGIVVPTLTEQGYNFDLPGLNFLAIRKGTNPEIVKKLYTAISDVYASAEYKDFAKKVLLNVNSWNTDEINAYIQEQKAVIEDFKDSLN